MDSRLPTTGANLGPSVSLQVLNRIWIPLNAALRVHLIEATSVTIPYKHLTQTQPLNNNSQKLRVSWQGFWFVVWTNRFFQEPDVDRKTDTDSQNDPKTKQNIPEKLTESVVLNSPKESSNQSSQSEPLDRVNAFLVQLAQAKEHLQQNINEFESIIVHSNNESLDDVDSLAHPNVPEEIVGKIRSVIGKSTLLINKKFVQFEELCNSSIVWKMKYLKHELTFHILQTQKDSEQFKINCDDLQGFWEMVLIQVDSISSAYDHLRQLKENGWRQVSYIPNQAAQIIHVRLQEDAVDSPIKPAKSKNSNQFKPASCSSPTSSPLTDREKQRKNQLLEIKRRGKMQKTITDSNEDVLIFSANKDNETWPKHFRIRMSGMRTRSRSKSSAINQRRVCRNDHLFELNDSNW